MRAFPVIAPLGHIKEAVRRGHRGTQQAALPQVCLTPDQAEAEWFVHEKMTLDRGVLRFVAETTTAEDETFPVKDPTPSAGEARSSPFAIRSANPGMFLRRSTAQEAVAPDPLLRKPRHTPAARIR